MSKSKTVAKTASKNNPVSRTAAKKYFYEGTKEVVPVKVYAKTVFMGAEYLDGNLVVDSSGAPSSWKAVASLCTCV